MKISIVIPVYNEADHLGACLEAIAHQSFKPYEVIVVDNNSSDDTAAIARRFSFVTLLSETRQGVVHARNRGFNAARGDIIGRIDADTVLPTDWAKQLNQLFRDPTVDAVSGSLHYYDIAASPLIDLVDSYMRGWMSRRMGKHVFLLGSNMALRRSAWTEVGPDACHRGNMHEDLDLAVHLSGRRQRVVYRPQLLAHVSARRIDGGLVRLCRYMLLSPQTYARHDIKERRYMYPLIAIVLLHYVALRIAFRGFDPVQRRFSWRSLLVAQTVVRVDPGLYVA